MSLANSTKLTQLARDIRSSYKTTLGLIKSSKDKTLEALTEAIVTAQKLKQAKEIIGHGGFERWQKQELRWNESDIRTGQRWMSKIKSDNVSFYAANNNRMKSAFQILGIIQDDDLAPSETLNGGGSQSSSKNGNGHNGSQSASSSSTTRPGSSSAAPLANSIAQASGSKPIVSAKPTISKDDALSRIRHLVNECVIDINNKLQSGLITHADLKAELKPLAEFVR